MKKPVKEPAYNIMDDQTYEINLKVCTIRPDKALGLKTRAETAWTVEIGVFAPYLKETRPALIDKCFLFDWNNMKAIKYKKSRESDIKDEMYKIYPQLKELYRN